MIMPARLVVIGSSNTDMVVKVCRLPAPGETVLGSEFVIAPGGKGANQAVAAAKLGAQVSLVARLGCDPFGTQALANFHAIGLNTEFVQHDRKRTSGVALIFVDERGENAIAVAAGANAALSTAEVERARPAIAQAQVVVLQLESPLPTVEYAARIAKECGAQVVLNPAPAAQLNDELLRSVDVLTPNEHEVTALVGVGRTIEQQQRLLARGVGAVVVTLGAEGASWMTATGGGRVYGRKVEARDATAAGDCFTGALAVALAEGRELSEAVEFANAAAAMAVTRLGAQPSLPTRDEVERLLQTA